MKRTSLIIGIVAVGIIATFAWRSVARVPDQPDRAPTSVDCTPAAIRAVPDALERSILAARCAKLNNGAAPPQR